MSAPPQVILLPGGVLPAGLAYESLLAALEPSAEVVAKDLEVYAGESPPGDYGLATEVGGIERAADAAGFERMHLVGYSAGGAASLAFAAEHPARVRSLALLEPAWAGNEALDPAEASARRELDRATALPPQEMLPAFIGAQLRPGATPPPPPPPGPPTPWMRSRPAGLQALTQAFAQGRLDLGVLEALDAPVYFALGGMSNPDVYERMADRLAGVFRSFELEVFADRHHFDPPHRAEPDRLAASLTKLWGRAEEA